MYKAIVFDLDGTLIDTDVVIIDSWRELINTYKDKDFYISDDVLRTFSGPPIQQSIAKVFPEYDGDFILKEYRQRSIKHYNQKLHSFKHTRKTIQKLKKDGYLILILTQKNKDRAIFSLKKCKIYNLFDCMLTCDDLSKPKPDSQGIEILQEKYNLKNEDILYVGDNYIDYQLSLNANVDCVLMTMAKRDFKDKMPHPKKFLSSMDELYLEVKANENN